MKPTTWNTICLAIMKVDGWVDTAHWFVTDKVLWPLAVYAGKRSRGK